MRQRAGKAPWEQTTLAWLIVLFTILELALLRLALAVAILASAVMFAVLLSAPPGAPPRHARRGLVLGALLMLVAAAGPMDLAFRRTGRVWVGIKPIAWGHETKRAEAIARAGDVVFAGDLPPLNPARYAVVVSW